MNIADIAVMHKNIAPILTISLISQYLTHAYVRET